MIVVDTNVIVYLWLPCRETPLAEALLAKDAEWVAPTLWRSEFRNTLVGYVRRANLTLPDAQYLTAKAESRVRDYAVPSDAVLRAAAASSCSACDCEFVALATELRVPLVTADAQILSAFPSVACSLSSFASA